MKSGRIIITSVYHFSSLKRKKSCIFIIRYLTGTLNFENEIL
jgi:hypothetical protein